jgi:nucleotide-binding universal stress UspA family protein
MYERILVPVDDSDSMATVFEHAAELASRREAVVQVLHVVDDRAFLTLEEGVQADVLENLESEAERTTRLAADRLEKAGVAVETAVRQGDPAEQILDVVGDDGIDLVVMGTRRGSYRETMLGSVSQKVVAGASVPVLTVNVAEKD